MTDSLEQRILSIIRETLREQNDGKAVELKSDDSMETVPAWDSVSFMSIFLAINEAFDLDPDFDDAIHYTSVPALHSYLKARDVPVTEAGSQSVLLGRMREVVLEHADQIAVREGDREINYAEFGAMIGALHGVLGAGTQPVGLLLDRSAAAYAAMWAAIGRGRPYVPLNTTYPKARLSQIIAQAGVGTVVCDESTRELALALGLDDGQIVLAAPPVSLNDSSPSPWWQADAAGDVAYKLFTSGSTGQPKGVPITYDNLLSFIDNLDSTIPYLPTDVCSQVCELSFDVSVHEIFLALLNGCTLCPARRIDLFNPAQYIARCAITVWTSVPSLARVILRNGVATRDALDTIRLSMFNGEALTAGLAASWSEAAANSDIWNTYGPTECTVAVTTQRWIDDPALAEADVVAIGQPFPDCVTALLDEGRIVPTTVATDGHIGELLLATPQQFAGYTDPDLPSPFVVDDGGTRFYRTGDRVLWRSGRIYHLGRLDHQVKIGGHRIELLEIEHQLRRCYDSDSLAVIAYPARLPTELVLFVAGASEALALQPENLGLPAYMLPKRSILLDDMPTNAHGKLDRSALQSLAETAG